MAAGSHLTPREAEILRWISQGKSNMEIGVMLGINALTVKDHVRKILRKLQVQNRTQAVARAVALRILAPHEITAQSSSKRPSPLQN